MTVPDNPVSIDSPRPLRVSDTVIVLCGRDAAGAVQICVTPMLWESLLAEAPYPGDDADQRDYALMCIEALASGVEAARDAAGHRLLFVG